VRLHKQFSTSAAAFVFASSVAASSLALPAGAYGGSSDPPAAVVSTSTIHIDNFGRVNGTYYRGAQPKGRDYADLAAVGVKTVINLTSDDADVNERTSVERAGMKYFQIAMTTHDQPKSSELAEFLEMVNDPANQPVYVHCVGGRHRTGVMTAAYRMTHDGWSADQAFSEMKQYKFGADFLHPEFKEFVYRYQPVLAHATASVASSGAPSVR
jgi:tyrosine-protein phosphatase SIW14